MEDFLVKGLPPQSGTIPHCFFPLLRNQTDFTVTSDEIKSNNRKLLNFESGTNECKSAGCTASASGECEYEC